MGVTNQRIYEGMRYLGRKRSVTRDEFHAAHRAGAAMLLDGLLSNGYAVQKGHRVILSQRGRTALSGSIH